MKEALAPGEGRPDDPRMDGFSSLAGRLLIAMPGIDDDRFRQAVILVCAHGPDHAMGVRIDQPLMGIDLSTVLEKLDLPPPTEGYEAPVLIGGPVERERGFVLHTDDWISDSTSLAFGDGLALTGTRDVLLAMSDPVSGPRLSRLMLGYAGWDEGQLEAELTENIWLTAEADTAMVFDDDHETKWSRALAGMGVDAARLSGTGGRA